MILTGLSIWKVRHRKQSRSYRAVGWYLRYTLTGLSPRDVAHTPSTWLGKLLRMRGDGEMLRWSAGNDRFNTIEHTVHFLHENFANTIDRHYNAVVFGFLQLRKGCHFLPRFGYDVTRGRQSPRLRTGPGGQTYVHVNHACTFRKQERKTVEKIMRLHLYSNVDSPLTTGSS
jgi:hypothetical protein